MFTRQSIRINKSVVMWLVITWSVGLGWATMGERPLEGDVDQEMYIVGKYPKVGDIFDVKLRVRLKEQNHLHLYPEKMVAMGYIMHVSCRPSDPIEILTEKEKFVPVLKPGKWYEFLVKLKITKPAKEIRVLGGTRFKASKSGVPINMPLYLLDSVSGQYGTKEEWLKRAINVFWKYNNVEPQWLLEPDQTWEASNRKIAEEMRRFEPSLSDSEALCLHQDNYLLIINAIGDANATDSERVEHLLKAGWLDAQRSGAEAKEKCFKDFTEKNKGRWGGNPNFNFFRGDKRDQKIW